MARKPAQLLTCTPQSSQFLEAFQQRYLNMKLLTCQKAHSCDERTCWLLLRSSRVELNRRARTRSTLSEPPCSESHARDVFGDETLEAQLGHDSDAYDHGKGRNRKETSCVSAWSGLRTSLGSLNEGILCLKVMATNRCCVFGVPAIENVRDRQTMYLQIHRVFIKHAQCVTDREGSAGKISAAVHPIS